MFGKASLRDHVTGWVDRAIDIQDGALRAYLSQVIGTDPDGNGDPGTNGVGSGQAAAALESQYLATTSGAGAAVGGAASVPGVGTPLALGLSVAETVAFLDATAMFTLAAAELTRTSVTDLPRRRALLLLVLLGDGGTDLVPVGDDGSADGWGRRLADLSDEAVAEINRTAEKWLLTRFGARQSLYVLGRLAPFGIGAAVGAAGNALTAKGVIARVRSAFAGAAPEPATEPAPVASAPVGEPLPATSALASVAVDHPAVGTPWAGSDVVAVDPPTGKYAGLFTLLSTVTDDEAVLPITTVDGAVTGGLPAAARRNAAWWSNEPATRAPQARAWLAAGFHVSGVALADDAVVLRRGPAPAETSAEAGAETSDVGAA